MESRMKTAYSCLLGLALAACTSPAPPNHEGPTARLEEPAARPQDQPPSKYTNVRVLELPVPDDRVIGMSGVELHYSLDDGQSWINHGLYEGKPETVRFTAPRDGKYLLVLVPVDKSGARAYTPDRSTRPDHVVVLDTLRPVVEVKSPNGGELFAAGQGVIVTWLAEDKNLAPNSIRIEISLNRGTNWTAIGRDLPNSGTYLVDLPRASSQDVKIRVMAYDLAGNAGEDESDSAFTIDGLAPDVTIVGPATARESPFKLQFAATDLGGAGMRQLRLYVTKDNGQTWEVYGDHTELEQPFMVGLLDGVYGLRMTGIDKVGNAGRAPAPGAKPDHIVLVDTTPPQVKLLGPKKGAFVAEEEIELQWSAKDNLDLLKNAITILTSEDGGANWMPVEKNYPNTGSFKFRAPARSMKDFRVRVEARDVCGNVGRDDSEPLIVDAAVPYARALSVVDPTERPAKIEYEIRERGFAPVTRVTLYWSPDDGKTWFEGDDDPDLTSPIPFTRADGKYRVAVVCATEAGLRTGKRQKAPERGAREGIEVILDGTPPVLNLQALSVPGQYYRTGQSLDVLWSLREANPDRKGLKIVHSRTGQADKVVAEGLDPTAERFKWTVPAEPGGEHVLKFIVRDAYGNEATYASKVFRIDGDPPTVKLERLPKTSRSRRVEVRWAARDETSGVARVEIYGKKLDGKSRWGILHSSTAAYNEDTFEFPSDGTWGVFLVAEDQAGNRSAEMDRDPEPMERVVVDMIPPALEVKAFETPSRRVAFVNDKYEVVWEAKDDLTPAPRIRIRIEYSLDVGKTWHVAVHTMDNVGRASLYGFLFPGKQQMLKVIAYDEAGNDQEKVVGPFDADELPKPAIVVTGLSQGQQIPEGGDINLDVVMEEGALRKPKIVIEGQGIREEYPLEKRITLSSKIKKGTYKLWVEAVDRLDRTVRSPEITFGVSIPPVPSLVLTVSPKQAEYARGSEVEFTVPSTVDLKEVWLEMEHDGTYQRLKTFVNGRVSYRLPSAAGEYRFRAWAKDRYDRTVTSAEDLRIKVIVPEIRVKLQAEWNGMIVEPEKMMHLTLWGIEAHWPNIKELYLELFDGQNWKELQKVDSRRVTFAAPSRDGKYRVRVRGKDRLDRLIASEDELGFTVVEVRPVAILQLNRVKVLPGETVTGTLTGEVDEGTAHIEFVRKIDRSEWKKLDGRVSKGSVTFAAPDVPGWYVVRVVSQSGPSNTADFEVSGSQGITLLNFHGGAYPGGQGQIIFVRPMLPEVTVEFSEESGKEGTWKRLGSDQVTAHENGLHWKLPQITRTTCRLRVRWKDPRTGVEYVSESTKDFVIDSVKPVVGQVRATVLGLRRVKIEAEVKPSVTRVRQLIYLTGDGGATWKEVAAVEGTGPAEIDPGGPGKYGVIVVVRSEAGFASGEVPGPGAASMATFEIGEGMVRLLTQFKGTVAGGQEMVIEVESGEIQDAELVFYNGKEEQPIGRGKRVIWKVPKEEYEGCEIRVKVAGEIKARSTAFSIDSTPPVPKDMEIKPVPGEDR